MKLIKTKQNAKVSAGVINVSTLHNLKRKLQDETQSLWREIFAKNISYHKPSLSEKRYIKGIYKRLIDNENALIHTKIILQVINFGIVTLPEEEIQKGIYAEIFKLAEYKQRILKLTELPVPNTTNALKVLARGKGRQYSVLDTKFVNKELEHLIKLIDKTQYKINQYNLNVTINLDDLSMNIVDSLHKLVA